MDVKASHTYTAPIDSVLDMLRDPTATKAKYEGMGHRDVDIVDCHGDGNRLHVESSRVVDVDLPGFAKRVLKPTNKMRQTDDWHAATGGEWAGTFKVDVQGAPVHMEGTMRLTPGNGTCTEDIAVTVTVKVPLVGGKIADWAGRNDVRRTLDAEFAFGDQWLASHPA